MRKRGPDLDPEPRREAGAAPRAPRDPQSRARLERIASIGAYLAMLLGIFGLMGSGHLLGRGIVPLLAQAFAVAVFVWARLVFGRRSFHLAAEPTPGGIVTSGPYRLVRHPIYAAVCLFAWAGVLPDASPLPLACALVITAGAVVRVRCEERLLLARYPGYRRYADSTGALVPRSPSLFRFGRSR